MQDNRTVLWNVRLCAISCNQERTDVHVLTATRAAKVRFSTVMMSKNELSRSTQMPLKHRGVQLGIYKGIESPYWTCQHSSHEPVTIQFPFIGCKGQSCFPRILQHIKSIIAFI